jgi:hypothetical protein
MSVVLSKLDAELRCPICSGVMKQTQVVMQVRLPKWRICVAQCM